MSVHIAVYLSVVYNCAGSSMKLDTAANSTDKSQPFEIKTEDITEHYDIITVLTVNTLKTKSMLKYHLRIHSDAKPYPCRHCSERFARLDQLTTHLLTSHNQGI